MGDMKRRKHCAAVGLVVCLLVAGVGRAEGKTPQQTGWGSVPKGLVEVRRKPSSRKPGVARLNSGALVATFRTHKAGGIPWTEVRVVESATLEVRSGWVESNQIQTLPLDQFPSDADLLKALGGVYLQDFNATYTRMARFLVKRGEEEPALLCYIGSPFLPHTRLQVFEKTNGKLVAGPFLEISFSQMKTGVAEIEVRDLVGDGNECIITREPFTEALGNAGLHLVIRRIEADGFKVLWKAPLELRSLSSYPPRPEILEPAEKNIGAPGTVTTATFELRPRGRVSELVWKGKIEFRVLGREAPVETLTVEKVCGWNGKEFAPLR